MAFTRFNDDPNRIIKQLQQSTDVGRYVLNVPGNLGDKPCFMADPHIRMDKWGANMRTNTTSVESDLLGLTRTINRDCQNMNSYKDYAAPSAEIKYPVCGDRTNQSRVTHPAWEYRDLEQGNWENPIINPQLNVNIPFHNNISTRILEKDNHLTKIPTSFNGNI
jgi:hypothetical protein